MGVSKVYIGWVPQKGGILLKKPLKSSYQISVGGLPTSIQVIKPPDKTTYKPGEKIDPTGIIVKAYYEDGSEYGVIPIKQLQFEPNVISDGSGNS